MKREKKKRKRKGKEKEKTRQDKNCLKLSGESPLDH